MPSKRAVSAPNISKPIGPYSLGIEAGGFLFISGQTASDAQGQPMRGNIGEQTRLILQKMLGIAAAAGYSAEDVVKTTVFLKDIDQFSEMNIAYATFFGDVPPARSTVQVARLPRDHEIEIEMILWNWQRALFYIT